MKPLLIVKINVETRLKREECSIIFRCNSALSVVLHRYGFQMIIGMLVRISSCACASCGVTFGFVRFLLKQK